MFIKELSPIPLDQYILGLGFLFILAFIPTFVLLFLIFRNSWKIKKIIMIAVVLAVILELVFLGIQAYRSPKIIY